MQRTFADQLAKLAKTTGHRDPKRLLERDLPKLPLLEKLDEDRRE